MEQFGAGSGTERVKALAELALKLAGAHVPEATPLDRSTHKER